MADDGDRAQSGRVVALSTLPERVRAQLRPGHVYLGNGGLWEVLDVGEDTVTVAPPGG